MFEKIHLWNHQVLDFCLLGVFKSVSILVLVIGLVIFLFLPGSGLGIVPSLDLVYLYKWTYLENRNRHTDLEDELTVAGERFGEGVVREFGMDCMHCCI